MSRQIAQPSAHYELAPDEALALVESGRLRIKGDRLHPYPGDHAGTVHLIREIEFGIFETVIEAPQGYDLTGAKASYANGLFRIEVPKQL